MAEDLSRFVTLDASGTPKPRPGVMALPPMRRNETSGDAPAEDRGETTSGKPRTPKRKTADRFATLNAFVDSSLAGLSRVELGAWLVLYRDTRNGTACSGQADIARRLGVSDRAVKTAVGKLLRCGLLTLVYRGGLNRGPSRYRVEPIGKARLPNKGTGPP